MFSKTNLIFGTIFIVIASIGCLKDGGNLLEFLKTAWAAYLVLPIGCFVMRQILKP